MKAIFKNRRRASSAPSLELRGQKGAPRHLPPAAAPGPAPGKVAVRTARPGDARLSRGTLGRARPGARGGARRSRLQPPGTRATVRPREGRPRARRCPAGRAPDLSPSPLPRSPPPPLSSPQPRRDHVDGDRERPHRGPGGDPGVQLQQGQQAPGPHHAVPHRGRGRPFRGGDSGEPGIRPPTPPLPAGAVSRTRGPPRPSPIFRRFCPHPGSPDAAASQRPGSARPVCPSSPSPRWLPRNLQNPTDHPSFSVLRCSPRRPGETRHPPSGLGAASLVQSRLASSSPQLNFSPGL